MQVFIGTSSTAATKAKVFDIYGQYIWIEDDWSNLLIDGQSTINGLTIEMERGYPDRGGTKVLFSTNITSHFTIGESYDVVI
jgi:hypothetical protein